MQLYVLGKLPNNLWFSMSLNFNFNNKKNIDIDMYVYCVYEYL